MTDLIKPYADFVAHRPIIVLLLAIVITFGAMNQSAKVQIEDTEFQDFFPDDLEVIETLILVEQEFGSTESALIVVQLDPDADAESAIVDVRDPKAIEYVDVMSQLISRNDKVEEVSSAATVYRMFNNDKLPNSIREAHDIAGDNQFLTQFISKDYDISVVRITLDEDAKPIDVEAELAQLILEVKKPSGLKVSLNGELVQNPLIDRLIAGDMAKTASFSLIGIIVVLLLLFRSAKYGLTPLLTIILGVLWTFGFLGVTGTNISSITSGVISMIMGIGIDFGIQITARFRYELQTRKLNEAMAQALSRVIKPMMITAISALIGFQAMRFGQLKFLSELGVIMGYGVAMSMIAAVSVVPALLVLEEKINIKSFISKLLLQSR